MNPRGIKVTLKFFLSKGPDNVTKLISRTLGKLSLISDVHQGIVQDQEIWICEIEQEIGPNKKTGAFMVKPLKKVDPEKIKKLIPGFYSTMNDGNTVFLYPKENQSEPWIISINTRKLFNKRCTAIIVPIQYSEPE